jgi:hypothetical protein
MDGNDERRSSPPQSSRTRRALEGDWSEGLPGPAYAHGLPAPEPLGLAVRTEATPKGVPPVAAEAAVEPAVEAPADWGAAAAEPVALRPAEAPPAEPGSEDDFPVTLSEADEIHEETTAPVDLEPFEETAVEEIPAEVALAEMEAAFAPAETGSAQVEGPPPEFEAPPAEFEVPPAEAAPPDAAGADWLAHPDAAAASGDATAASEPPAATWEEATFATESNLESAFAAAEAAPAEAEVEVEVSFAEPSADAAPAADAWGEPTATPPEGSPEIEPWAAPVETPPLGTTPPSSPAAMAGSDFADMPPPKEGGELTEEPPEPEWSHVPREMFSPLPKGATLSDEEQITETAFAPQPGTPASPERGTPPQLELVREPEPLEDSDLLVPVEDATAPLGVEPVPPAPPLIVPGEQRVAIHTRAGQTRRGTVTDLDLSQSQIQLEPQGGGSTETIDHGEVKAIFFMLAPGEKAEPADGRAVRVTFSDGRTIEGHRLGEDSSQGFFLVPLDAQRTNTRRIYVASDAVSEMVELPQ